jgi:hypothetical protein
LTSPLPSELTSQRHEPNEPNDEERRQRLFDARYRWLIRRELSQLAVLPEGDRPDALRDLYERAAPIIRKDVENQGFDPLRPSKRALEAVAFSTQKLRLALSQNLQEE